MVRAKEVLPRWLLAALLSQVTSLAPERAADGSTGARASAEPRPAAARRAEDPPRSAAFRGRDTIEVELTALRRHPTRFLGRRVRFVLQFERLLEGWNPLLTRFGAGDWVGFGGWADERFTWEREVFDDPMRRLFAPRGSAVAELARAVRPHERFEVVGVVREVFLDEPWIEVEALRPKAEIVGEGVILHAVRARDAMARERWSFAIDQLDRAMAAPLPDHARAALAKLRTECVERAGEAGEDVEAEEDGVERLSDGVRD